MVDPDPQTPPPSGPPGEPRRRTAAPLLWLVLLLALLAFGWFIYNERSGMGPAPEALPPAPVAIGDGQDAAAERERARDDARRAARDAPAADARARARTAPAPASAVPDREATPLVRVEPEYPVEAYRKREEGTVLVGATVAADGRPASVAVIRRSGSRALDQAAVDAVRQWTFDPAVRGGRRIAADVEVPVTFRIDR